MGRGGVVEVLAVAGLYVAGVIGAGFASGQEIVVFFLNYGWGGFAGTLLTLVLLSSTVVVVLEFCSHQGITSYEDLFPILGGRCAPFFDWIYSLFLLIGMSVMLAGSATLGAPYRFVTALLVFLVLQKGVRAVLEIGSPLALILVVVLGLISLSQLRTRPPGLPETGSWRGLEAALLYSSYNLGFSMALLASVHHVLTNSKQRWAVSLLGNLILGLLLALLFFALGTLTPKQLADPLPAQHLAYNFGRNGLLVYKLMIWLAMYTTTLANALALVTRITIKGKVSWVWVSLLVLVGAILLSYVGFGTLIRVAYPLLGLGGLWLLANLLRIRFL